MPQMDSSGLKCRSLEELLEKSTLTEQQTRQLENRECDDLYITMKKLVSAADKSRGDLEEEYRLLMKAGEVSAIIFKHPKRNSWNKADALMMKTDASRVLERLSNLQTLLNKKYDAIKYRQDHLERVASQEAADKKQASGPMRNPGRPLISPRELIRMVEKDEVKKSAIIFDYRKDQSDSIHYQNEQITIIQVPPNRVESNMTFHALRNNLSVNQRGLLQRLSGVDFVVLMEEDTPELMNGSALPGKSASWIFKALTQYSSSEYRLKERPVFMDGGFRMWKNQYPTYTHHETPLSARSMPNDELDDVISKYQSEVHRIHYPDVMGTLIEPPKQTFQPQIPPRPPTFPPAGASSSSNMYPSIDPIQPSPIPYQPQPPPPQKSGSVVPPVPNPYTTGPNFPPTSTAPTTLERPGAPIFNPGPAATPQRPDLDRTSKPSFPERPALLKKQDPSPTRSEGRQNGGGDPLKRPPLLDRGTKPLGGTVSRRRDKEFALLSIHDQMTMAIERSSKRSGGHPNCGSTGLYNQGNTCFMSATLQCLFQTPGLVEVFTRKAFTSKVNPENRMGSKGVVSAAFSALADAVWSGNYEAISPARFIQLFADEVSSVLSDGRQHDASEFQIFLLDALHEDTNQAKRIGFEQNYKGAATIRREAEDFLKKHHNFSYSPVNQLLGSLSVSEIKCQTCGESSATFEENTIISVELTSTSQCTLDSCLLSHFSETTLSGDSKWNCPKCKTPRVSTRRSKLWALPPVMIIHLKRFALINGHYEKNETAVKFDPQRFDAKPYLHEAASKEKTMYKLYAATIHNGRLNSGHYTAVASHLRDGKWLRFDDETVRHSESYGVDQRLAYILFYKRC